MPEAGQSPRQRFLRRRAMTIEGLRYLVVRVLPPTILAVVAIWVALPYRWAFFATDEGLYYYEALKLLRGEVIYRDFFQFITPGVFFFIKWVFQLFGPNVIAVRYILFILLLAELWLLYELSWHLVRSVVAAMLPPLLYLLIARSQAWWSIQHHPLSHFLALLTAYSLVRVVESGGGAWMIASGLFAGAAFCVTQHLGVALLLIVFFWIAVFLPFWEGRRILVPAVWTICGAAIPLASLTAYLLVHGSLDDAYACTVEWVVQTYRVYHAEPYFYEGRLAMSLAWSRLPSLNAISELAYLFVVGYLPPLALLAGTIYFAAALLRSRRRGRKEPSVTHFGIVLSVGGAVFAEVSGQPTYWSLSQSGALGYLVAVYLLAHVWRWERQQLVVPIARSEVSRHWHVGVSMYLLRGSSRSVALSFHSSAESPSSGAYAASRAVLLPPPWLAPRKLARTALAVFLAGLLTLTYAESARRLFSIGHAVRRGRVQRSYITTPYAKLWSTDPSFVRDLSTVQRYVQDTTNPRDRIFVFYWSAYVYLVCDRNGATPFSGTLPGYHSPPQIDQMVRTISKRRIPVIVEDRILDWLVQRRDARILSYGLGRLAGEPVAAAVRQNYRVALDLKNFTVHVPK